VATARDPWPLPPMLRANDATAQFITFFSETANRVQSKYFCIKFRTYAQNVHHRPRRMRSDFC